MSMKLPDFKKEFDEKYNRMKRMDEIEGTDVVITKSSGNTLIIFMRDQEVLEWIKVE